MLKGNFKTRLVFYLIGLFIMTIGIALSVKSDLGVSPVSSIPYTMQLILGIEMGRATILFHIFLVVLQILLLRKDFKWFSLSQILIGIVFGYFTTFCNGLAAMLPDPKNIAIRVIMALSSTVFVAVGIFFYLPADIIPLAGEGAMKSVSQVTHIPFSKVKVGFDISMVVISLISCLIALHSLGAVGIGTIIAAILVGTEVGIINKQFGDRRDRLFFGSRQISDPDGSPDVKTA
ncbi:MAG: YitT family protein [Bilifractor sp.]